jgi:serine/threonine protein kinase
VHLASGLKRRDGSLAAVAALGARRDAREFDRGDRWFVAGLTSAAASAWDRESPAGTGAASPAVRGNGEAAFECPACGSVSGSTPLLCRCRRGAVLSALPHRLADKFLVERRLGAGGMGVVYLARDIALDRDVALKTLPMLRDGNVARLQREARAMASLNHEGLATIYGLEQWRRTPVLVVEYFPDGTLARRLSSGPLSPAATIQLGIRLADALAYMHARGVLHRDLKPSNIGLTPAGAPKLLDFGLATLTDGLDVSPLAGTPAYLPPEAHGEWLPDASYDLWALSIVLLEAIVGRHPLAAGPLDRTAIGVPGLLAFFDRALAISPEHRFHTAGEFRQALVDCRV